MDDPEDTRDDLPDSARRRLMKLAAWVPAGVVSLTAARAHAGRADITGGTKSSTSTSTGVKG